MKVKSILRKAGACLMAGALIAGSSKFMLRTDAAPSSMDEKGNINVTKIENEITIDGKISGDEWGDIAFTIAEGQPFINVLDHQGVFPADFTGDIYLRYDNQNVYIGAVAEYEVHKNEALLPSDIWQGDCMQIQISAVEGNDRNEMGFALNSLTGNPQAVAWASVAPFNLEGGEGKDYCIVREGNVTTYEIKLPISCFSSSVTELADGGQIPFSIAFPMSGGGFYEYKSGIVSEKNISAAGLLGLGAAPGEKVMDENGNFTLSRLANAPVIDGNVLDGEWGAKAFTIAEGQPFINVLDHEGVFPADFTADIYLSYDSQKVYLAAVTEYEVHKNEALLPSDIWQGDCMQIQISAVEGTDRNEMGFALNSLTGNLQAVAWASMAPFDLEGGEGKDYCITRNGNQTIYEIALPVACFSSSVTELNDGMQIPFSIAFPMSGSGFYEYKGGIVSSKDIQAAGLLGLSVKPAASAPAGNEENNENQDAAGGLLDSRTSYDNRTVPGIIEAEDYSEVLGTETRSEECSEGTLNMGWTADGDYFVYKDVNFTKSPKQFSIRTAGSGTPNIKVYVDGLDGTLIADFNIEASGDWQTWITNTVDVVNADGLTGVHDVYVMINGGMNLNWIGFDIDDEPAEEIEETKEPTETPAATSTPAPTTAAPSSDSSDDDGNNTLLIVGIIIAIVVIAGVVVVFVRKKKK